MDQFNDFRRELRQPLIAGLKFKRRDARPSRDHFDQERNYHAIRSALLRGDQAVTLLNQDTWDLADDRTDDFDRHGSGSDPAAMVTKYFQAKPPPKHPALKSGEPSFHRVQLLISPKPPYDGVQFHLDSVIGSGGNGVVLAMTAEFENGQSRRLAIKVPKNHQRQPNLDSERRWHQAYTGATHIVQHIDIAELARQNKVTGCVYPNGSQPFNEQALGILVLERADYGNLWDFMNRIVHRRLQIPDQVLWSVWLCSKETVANSDVEYCLADQVQVIKMLASVDYQPASNASQTRDFETFLQTMHKTSRPIADYVKDWAISHHVHFDTEFQNVLLAEDSSNQHGQHPLLKLHDFDDKWSKDMRRAWADGGWTEEDYWHMRRGPKNLYTPEQLASEWDSFQPLERHGEDKFRGPDLRRGTGVAGRYGSWTNVFLAGTLMECIMTGAYLRHPFCYQEYQFTYPIMRRRRTYGWRLAQATSGDPALREIVMKCQISDPRDRPTTVELLEHARSFMPPDNNSGADLREFYHRAFNAPPPVAI